VRVSAIGASVCGQELMLLAMGRLFCHASSATLMTQSGRPSPLQSAASYDQLKWTFDGRGLIAASVDFRGISMSALGLRACSGAHYHLTLAHRGRMSLHDQFLICSSFFVHDEAYRMLDIGGNVWGPGAKRNGERWPSIRERRLPLR